MTPLEIFFTTLGMAAVTLLFRAFFLIPEQDLPMPNWLREGLRYAPIAALAAVVAPEMVMTQGHLIQTLKTHACSVRPPGCCSSRGSRTCSAPSCAEPA